MKEQIEKQTKLYVAEITEFSGEDYPHGVFIDKNGANEWLDKHAFLYGQDNIPEGDDIVTCEDYIAKEYTVNKSVSVGDTVYVHCSNGVDSAYIRGVHLVKEKLPYGYYKEFKIK